MVKSRLRTVRPPERCPGSCYVTGRQHKQLFDSEPFWRKECLPCHKREKPKKATAASVNAKRRGSIAISCSAKTSGNVRIVRANTTCERGHRNYCFVCS